VKFEHLVEINNLNNPLQATLSRAQLWQGLLHRIEDARPFLPGLEACTIVERGELTLTRRLNFGGAVIEDRVTYEPEQWVCFTVMGTGSHAGGTLTITIECPDPQHPEGLFLRFAYATTLGEQQHDEDAAYAEFVKAAYHESDLETVRVIRTLLADGPSQ
jgi:hypothetical protein